MGRGSRSVSVSIPDHRRSKCPASIQKTVSSISSDSDPVFLDKVSEVSEVLNKKVNIFSSNIYQVIGIQETVRSLYQEAKKRNLVDSFDEEFRSALNRSPFKISKGIDRSQVLDLHYNYVTPEGHTAGDYRSLGGAARLGRQMNAYLRGEDPLDGHPNSERMKKNTLRRAETLEKFFIPTKEETMLLRGFKLDWQIAEGEIVHSPGFLSMTAKRPEATRFANPTKDHNYGYLLELKIPKGTPYISIWSAVLDRTSQEYVAEEQEILLPTNQKIKFESQINTLSNCQVWQASLV